MQDFKPKTARERIYEKEKAIFSPYATFSENTKGRARPQEECFFRTAFQRDRDKIIYSNSFKRLKNKTQVFFAPEGDHYITRLTHTFDVSQIARSITRALDLNEDLAEAIALGHDLGHTPFGHVGERVLNKLSPHGFKHNEQSLRVVDVLEREGKGLNLTQEVRDGILQHKISGKPMTLEGVAVSFADRIAYINHDIEDALRAGGNMPVVLNGANEVLVDLFLNGKIRFIDIPDTLERILEAHNPQYQLTLDDILQIDQDIRRATLEMAPVK